MSNLELLEKVQALKELKVMAEELSDQISVLEGEITQGDLKALKRDLASVINPEYDSVLFYVWRTEHYASREALGVERAVRSNFV